MPDETPSTTTTPTLPQDDSAIWRQLASTPFSYLAGAAGSGKTFLTKAWAEEQAGIELCATTGIAALNLGGTTINALLGFFDTANLQEAWVSGRLAARLGKLYRNGLRRIVLDEVSMLAGDQLTFLVEAIEQVNQYKYVRGRDRGGAQAEWEDEEDWTAEAEDDHEAARRAQERAAPSQDLGLTLVGDFGQLGPVKSTYAFESPMWEKFASTTYTLTEIRRQADPGFIAALRAARRGEAVGVLDYFAPRLSPETDNTFAGPTIFAKNAAVDRYNWLRLSGLNGQEILFTNRREGKQRSEWGSPTKPSNEWGVPPVLRLKIGALVMILANERIPGPPGGLNRGFLYVNGDLGEVVEVNAEQTTAYVKLHRDGRTVAVRYVRREILQDTDAARRKELRATGQENRLTDRGKEVVGWVEYMPLRVAYAATVHKTQGLSLDEVQVNLGDHFFSTGGMLYVALSRARTAEGLRIVGTPELLRLRCSAESKVRGFL